MAIGHHAPMTEQDALDIAALQVPWTEEQMIAGLIDHVWALVGGGRVVVGAAPSVEDFEAMLVGGPDSPTRVWSQVSEIQDALELLRDRLRERGPGIARR